MTEEQKLDNEQVVEQEETANAAANDVQTTDVEMDDEAPIMSDSKGPALEALPEEVLKKLEKRKADAAKDKAKKKKKKKVERKVTIGHAYVKATYNNTIVTLTDTTGAVISWASAGIAGFKGAKKSTPYAASIICRIAVDRAKQAGLQEVSVFVRGVGTGREAAVRALNANGLFINSIKDITPIPHNGCRPTKPRRV